MERVCAPDSMLFHVACQENSLLWGEVPTKKKTLISQIRITLNCSWIAEILK